MAQEISDRDWRVLVQRVRDGQCTPFLGAGVAYGVLPLGSDIAKRLAAEYGYPMEDTTNLMAVTQYIGVQYDRLFVKEELVRMFAEFGPPDFADPLEPHAFLAGLPLPVYITTNYDNFMTRALELKYRDAKPVLCRWNPLVEDYVAAHPTAFDADPAFKPTVANPVVFHLHGALGSAASLVLMEDDYLEFLAKMSQERRLLPQSIEQRLTTTSLLFIGYRLADWNLRLILRGLSQYNLKNFNVAVMPPPAAPKTDGGAPEELREAQERQRRAQDYLTRYYDNIDVRVYWGTAREFLAELKQRLG